ncbi:MAG: EutN/CcmL family microcompartment protein [Bradymonadales bacterium]|nr:EutN/CcmL family microcompartment protein [Bradymonadales bacterium]
MLLGKIVGTLVSNRKDPKLEGMKLMVVQQIDLDCQDTGKYVIAVDAVGAGIQEVILYATGSSARQTVLTENKPVDAVVMAIVDEWEVDGVFRYQKYPESQ